MSEEPVRTRHSKLIAKIRERFPELHRSFLDSLDFFTPDELEEMYLQLQRARDEDMQ